ncbi:hypothetical protein BH23CHL4_BH23CHL4_01390 [soil metagenome]
MTVLVLGGVAVAAGLLVAVSVGPNTMNLAVGEGSAAAPVGAVPVLSGAGPIVSERSVC